MNKNIIPAVIALVISIGVGIFFIGSSSQSNLGGGLSDRDIQAVSLKVGPNGSKNNEIKAATCNLSITVARLPLATSSQPFDCAVTGISSGDVVWGALPSDGGSLSGTVGIRLSAIKASSTSGYAQVWLSHQSDHVLAAATSSFPLATTSFQVLYIDN